MSDTYSPLRLMILASLPCVGSIAHAEVFAIASSATETASVVQAPSINTVAQNSIFNPSKNTTKNPTPKNSVSFVPTLLGIFINGREQDSLDVLLDANSNRKDDNDHYYLSVDDLSRLTGVTFAANKPIDNDNTNDANDTNDIGSYQVSTPIGNTSLLAEQVIRYQDRDYIALSTLKQLGITANYSQQDLAVSLNMGWRPSQLAGLTTDNKAQQNLPVDYRPNRAGLLGLSFNSTLNASETAIRGNGFSSDNRDNELSTSRQLYADIGAFGYGLGGVWGVKAVGYDYSNSNDYSGFEEDNRRLSNDKSFARNALGGLSYLPSDWDNWEIDNLYWAKSGKNFATRIGTNRPNSLGQGAQTFGSEFTGALVAYSNRGIARHLSYFDEDTRSLLQNTSQDYQHLTGIGEPGGVAELRINGRAIARVQIGLDGRYEFLNLDVNQLALTETLVEMAIFAYPLAQQPLEVRPIILGKRRTNAATDELIIETGIGRTGDFINGSSRYNDAYNSSYNGLGNNDNHTAAHLYAEYGINNRLAVRGGVNNNLQNPQDNDNGLSWHVGANFSPMSYTNADLSYAHTPIQELWQAQLQYQRKKLLADYQYQARQIDESYLDPITPNSAQISKLNEQRHQLLLSYRPNDRTNINLNQYYDDLDISDSELNGYNAYTSINHRFSDSLNGSVNWNSRDDRYGYRLLWQDAYRPNRALKSLVDDNQADSLLAKNKRSSPLSYLAGIRDTVGLSGDNNSDTLSLRRQFNNRVGVGQSFSNLHGNSKWLYQGDVSYRFDQGFVKLDGTSAIRATDNLINIGYSLYDGNIGWLADWQLTHRNGLSFSLGYKHRYVDAIPSSRYNDFLLDNGLIGDDSLPAWTQNNYLYAKLSFDMFKAPKQSLKFGNYPRQTEGSVVVDIDHAADTPIDHENMRFELDKQPVRASLLSAEPTHSQYLIKDIKAGDYNLTMDAENLPLEYSARDLPAPRIRVSNYAPTLVPIELQKYYGFAGKVADAKEGVVIDIYKDNRVIQSITTGSYGYFQVFGLDADTYKLKAQGYEEQTAKITDKFLIGLKVMPESSLSMVTP